MYQFVPSLRPERGFAKNCIAKTGQEPSAYSGDFSIEKPDLRRNRNDVQAALASLLKSSETAVLLAYSAGWLSAD
jgi:hypothetical protein